MSAAVTEARLGGVVFALTEPNTGRRAEFDQWYRTDHRYSGALSGPGVVAGQFWRSDASTITVCPGPAEAAPTDWTGSRLAIFLLIDGAWDQFHSWSGPQIAALRSDGRMFEDRRRIHGRHYVADHGTGPAISWTPPSLNAIDRPFRGLLAVLAAAPSADQQELDRTAPVATASTPHGIDITLRSDDCPVNDEMKLDPHVLVLALRDRPFTSDVDVIAAHATSIASSRGLVATWASTFVPH